MPALGRDRSELETRFLHLDAAGAFSGSRGLISYERRDGETLHDVLWFPQDTKPRHYETVTFEIDAAGHLQFWHAGQTLADLHIRPSRPDRQVRGQILTRAPLVSLFSVSGLPYHGLHLLLSLLLPLLTMTAAIRFGLPLRRPWGYVMPLLLPVCLLAVTFVLLALQASALLV